MKEFTKSQNSYSIQKNKGRSTVYDKRKAEPTDLSTSIELMDLHRLIAPNDEMLLMSRKRSQTLSASPFSSRKSSFNIPPSTNFL